MSMQASPEPTARLSAAQIQAQLDQFAAAITVRVLDSTASTNSDLLQQLAEFSSPQCLIALEQTAGRGRAGRSWLSVGSDVLTFSIAWPWQETNAPLTGLPLAIGVALAECLNSLGLVVQLKWPNDVLRDGKKLAGILLETARVREGQLPGDWLVIGIGMNLRLSAEFEQQIERQVAEAPWLAQMPREQLYANLLNHLARACFEFSQQGLQAFQTRWQALHAYQNQNVVLLDQGQVRWRGRALGIDQQGALLLETADGVQTVYAGDISLRLSEN